MSQGWLPISPGGVYLIFSFSMSMQEKGAWCITSVGYSGSFLCHF
jgi:hypothetical protein